MDKEKIKQINQAILKEDFVTFDSLTEQDRLQVIETWNKKHWIKFRMRNTVTDEEIFDSIFKMIDEDED